MAVQRYKNANGEWVVLGQELKTINGQSIIGEGDITIKSGVSETYVEERLADVEQGVLAYVDTAIANAITNTLNTAV